MNWECDRHDWTHLRAMVNARLIPHALERFQTCANEQEADRAYWMIDNNAIVQGSLYEAALPATTCLVIALANASSVARPKILELLQQLGSGRPDPSEMAIGNDQLQQACLRELSKGLALYFSILESGVQDERILCIDLLGLCATSDSSLNEQVIWYYEKTKAMQPGESINRLIDGWINELR